MRFHLLSRFYETFRLHQQFWLVEHSQLPALPKLTDEQLITFLSFDYKDALAPIKMFVYNNFLVENPCIMH